jgi:uncharacterized Zn finger protein
MLSTGKRDVAVRCRRRGSVTKKLHACTVAALVLLSLVILYACGPAKSVVTVADDAYRQVDDFFRAGRTSREAVEIEVPKARRVVNELPPSQPVVSATESEIQRLWTDLRNDAICAVIKWMVDNEGLPAEEAIYQFVDEQIDKKGLKLLRGRPRIEGEINAVAKDVHSVAEKVQAALNGDKDAYVALLVELRCFNLPSYP